MRLVLTKASPKDYDQIVPLKYAAFDGSYENGEDMLCAFFGRPSPASYANTKKFLMHEHETEANGHWLKVVDEDNEIEVKVIGEKGFTGETKREKCIACFAYFKFFPTWVTPQPPKEAHDFSYLETKAEQQDAEKILTEYFAARYSSMSQPHVLCFMLATLPTYQGYGCGRILMEWGCNVADSMMLPLYLEATDAGRSRVYSKLDFKELRKTEINGEVLRTHYTNMIRWPRVSAHLLEVRKKEKQVNGHAAAN